MTKHNGLSNKVKGKVSRAKGEVKDQIGYATDNNSLQIEGKMDKLKGTIQEKIGESRNK